MNANVSVQAIGQLLFERNRLVGILEGAHLRRRRSAQDILGLLQFWEGADSSLLLDLASAKVQNVFADLVDDALLDAADVAAVGALQYKKEAAPKRSAKVGLDAVFKSSAPRVRAYMAWGSGNSYSRP